MYETLEQEFEKYKAQHKFTVLYAMVKRYYLALEAAGTQLTCSPDELTSREIARIVMLPDNLATFNRLYEKAWEDLAEYAI